METEKKILLDSAIDLVSFFNIVKDDMGEELGTLASDLDRSVDKNNNNVEIIHTGSGFEELSLPHIENFMRWNTDADHMIIRTDVEVMEEFQAKSVQAETNGNEADTNLVDAKSVEFCPGTEKQVREAGKADIIERFGSFKGGLGETKDSKTSANTSVRNSNLERSSDLNDNILYIYDGSHAGYVFVSNNKLSLSCPIDAQSIQNHCQSNSDFIESCTTTIPVSRCQLMAMDEGKITGPSYSLCTSGGSFSISRDFVYGLKCKFWPSQAQEWIERERLYDWPNKELISESVSQGCHIVPVASHNGNFGEFEWRFSFSVAELKLVQTMTENQKLAYSIIKAIIKHEMKGRKNDIFASYHLKTTLLWFLEMNDWKTLENQSLGESALELLDVLISFYSEGVLPNYFIRNNNMIDHRSSKEIDSVCEVLREIKTDFTMAVCRYIEANQTLPVFFDAPISQLLEDNWQKFHQVCKYNFLVMALAYILMCLRKGQRSVNGFAVGEVVRSLVQKASKETCVQEPASEDNGPTEVPTVAGVLGMIEQSLEKDKMKVTENSAVILAVFNLFLTFYPTPLDKTRFAADSSEFHKHLTNPAYIECLSWAGRLHEKHCDVIYEFVVKKWINGPSFQTKDEQARKLMKLLMVMLGKPTKQAGAITGSLVRREVENKRFILLRMLSEYLLHVHLESSYIAFQASGYLMNKSTISEIYVFINWGSYQLSKLRAVELILSKDELQAQLSEKELKRLVQMQHDLTQQTSSQATG